jgi:hypothetical protein
MAGEHDDQWDRRRLPHLMETPKTTDVLSQRLCGRFYGVILTRYGERFRQNLMAGMPAKQAPPRPRHHSRPNP